MDNAILVENLAKDYGDFKLKDVSFHLPKGTIMGFVGENGAGKTTTIKLLLNMIRKDAGNVHILGRDHIAFENQIKQEIGVVLDESHFHDNLKPTDISSILKSIYIHWNDGLFQKYLKKFGIPSGKEIKGFSKGMKTKLSICAALAHTPKLLILDEATSGLDPFVRNEILDIFLDIIQDEDRSVFMSTHITSDLEKIADYITLIHDGQIVFSKTKDELQYQFGIMRCGLGDFARVSKADMAGYRKGQFGYDILVKNKKDMKRKYAEFVIDPTSIEDIMLFYVRGDE